MLKAFPCCLQGRLIDHLRNTQSVGLEDLQALVLDEADRLLEMGFAEEVCTLSLISLSQEQSINASSSYENREISRKRSKIA